ncbi:hypothetical protein WN48_04354 [Eufriesea mexicana]|nr:hypothetical protein WN48_04354 [Eufriesea mexicana]
MVKSIVSSILHLPPIVNDRFFLREIFSLLTTLSTLRVCSSTTTHRLIPFCKQYSVAKNVSSDGENET